MDSVALVLIANQAKLKEGVIRLDKEKMSSNSKLRQISPDPAIKNSSFQVNTNANLEAKQSKIDGSNYKDSSPEKLVKSAIVANDSILLAKSSLPNISPVKTLEQDVLTYELNKKSNTSSPFKYENRTNAMSRSLELSNSGLAASNISNLRPTDVKILQSHGIQPMDLSSRNRGRQIYNQGDDYESQPLGVVREVELEEIEKYKRSAKFKSVERVIFLTII